VNAGDAIGIGEAAAASPPANTVGYFGENAGDTGTGAGSVASGGGGYFSTLLSAYVPSLGTAVAGTNPIAGGGGGGGYDAGGGGTVLAGACGGGGGSSAYASAITQGTVTQAPIAGGSGTIDHAQDAAYPISQLQEPVASTVGW
jgi:hypothetical protein